MVRKVSAIPNRLKNVSKGHPYVAGAVDIYDDLLFEDQQAINQDTYRKDEVYDKEEVNSIVSNTPETDVVVLDLGEEEDPLDVLNEVPVADRPNKLFRIRNAANTHYDEYGWTGDAWALLASKDYGIDDDITEGSDNLIKSSAVAKVIREDDNSGGIIFLDNFNNVLARLDSKGFRLFSGTLGTENPETVASHDTVFAIVDKYNVVLYKYKNVEDEEEDSGDAAAEKSAVYLRNQHLESILHAACKYNSKVQGEKTELPPYFQLLAITDTHEQINADIDFNDCLYDFETAAAGIHLGDMVETAGRAARSFLNDALEKLLKKPGKAHYAKPVYLCIGNHEAGPADASVYRCFERDELYEIIIRAMVDRGYLNEGEYVEGRCYYYHDFTDFAIPVRLIVLDPMDFASTLNDELWEAVEYDSTAPSISNGSNYSADDVVNVPNYTKHSFRAKEDIENIDTSSGSTQNPRYNEFRFGIWYSQDQLEWFADKIEEAANNGYLVITAAHYALASNSQFTALTEYDFCPDHGYQFPAYADGNRYSGTNIPIISDILDACGRGEEITRTIANASLRPITKEFEDPADPENERIITENADSLEGFTFSHDFGNVQRKLVTFHISGHGHHDGVAKDEHNQLELIFDCGKRSHGSYSDTHFSTDKDNIAYDTITAVTPRESAVHLCRIGNNCADKVREGRLVTRDNEFVSYNN